MKTNERTIHAYTAHGSGNPSGSGIFSSEEFRAIVKYERARSDRNGSVFSIIAFSAHDDGSGNGRFPVERIAHFSRSIDCIGLSDDGNVNILLPDTTRQGAEAFCRKIDGEDVKAGKKSLSFTIYSYPENWLSRDKGFRPEVGGKALPDGDRDPGYSSIQGNIEFLFVNRIPYWKRIMDVCGASLLLALASPISALLFIYIKIISPGPAIFKQVRIGYKGVPFDFYKFRTMKIGNNQGFHGEHAQNFIKSGDIPMEKLDSHDPRILFGGRVIRKCCLDELPQLWNVLKGDMSLVGPRPCIPYEAREYLRWHTHRFDVLPGMSGLWQVSGKNKLTFRQMVRLDIAYCNNMTILGDIAIILRTPLAILSMVFEAASKKLARKTDDHVAMAFMDIPRKAAH